jgi:hypothetical protein
MQYRMFTEYLGLKVMSTVHCMCVTVQCAWFLTHRLIAICLCVLLFFMFNDSYHVLTVRFMLVVWLCIFVLCVVYVCVLCCVCLFSMLCMFVFYVVYCVFCVLFLLLYITVSLLFVYNFTDCCHRVETQLQLINISYDIIFRRAVFIKYQKSTKIHLHSSDL